MKQIKITLAEIAEKRNMTVDEIKVIISDRIKFGMTSSNPEIRAQWKKIPSSNDIPTPEEWLQYVIENQDKYLL